METKTMTQDVNIQNKLEKLGFKQAAKNLVEKKARAKKLMIAYEHYRFVTAKKIHDFNVKLFREGKYLGFNSIESYGGVPPVPVLDALEVAQERGCFDAYEVVSIQEVKDPLLFGCIYGCTDKFFIAEWDDDIHITDLLKAHEG